MNDEFLTLHRPAVRPQFAAGLYDFLNHPTRVQRANAFLRTRRGLATAVVALLLLAACAQQVLSLDYHLAAELDGIAVYEMNYRIVRLPDRDYATINEGQVTESQWESLDNASTFGEPPFDFKVPNTLPPGFGNPEAMAMHPLWLTQDQPVTHVLRWKTQSGGSAIYLMVSGRVLMPVQLHVIGAQTSTTPESGVFILEAPSDELQAVKLNLTAEKWEQVQVNGQPAVLVQGDWSLPESTLTQLVLTQDNWILPSTDSDLPQAERIYWEDTLGLHLYWTEGSFIFHLAAYGITLDPADLVAIAESMN